MKLYHIDACRPYPLRYNLTFLCQGNVVHAVKCHVVRLPQKRDIYELRMHIICLKCSSLKIY